MSVLTRDPVEQQAVARPGRAHVARSLTNFFSRPSAGLDVAPLPRFTAWLNHADRIIALPTHWEHFAAAIDLPHLRREQVLGRPVVWFIEDETIRECYRVMLERLRADNRPVRILARCDEAHQPRAMQLRLVPMSAGAVECSWSFLHGFTAAEVPDAARCTFGPLEHVRMCSWCRRVHVGRTWEKLETAAPALGLLDHHPLPPITHGICPQCNASVIQDAMPVA